MVLSWLCFKGFYTMQWRLWKSVGVCILTDCGHSHGGHCRDGSKPMCTGSYPSAGQISWCKWVARTPLGQDAEVACEVPDQGKLLSMGLYPTGISGTSGSWRVKVLHCILTFFHMKKQIKGSLYFPCKPVPKFGLNFLSWSKMQVWPFVMASAFSRKNILQT